jgi:hypothetical protein
VIKLGDLENSNEETEFDDFDEQMNKDEKLRNV